jgi:predicted dehydrogenase
MKILIVGLGSIGKKHLETLENLKSRYVLEIFKFSPTSYKEPAYFKELSHQIKTNKIEAIIICNPTILHLKTANLCLHMGLHVFVEKPLSHNYEPKQMNILSKLAAKKNLKVMVGYDMRFNPWIRKAKEMVGKGMVGDVWSLRIMAGQYLPDWRKTDYRKVYSAKKKLGGGVLLDLSHEIDYLTWLMSKKILRITARKAYTKRIHIETEDICSMIVEYADRSLAEIHLDYLNIPYRRSMEVCGEKGTIVWDGNLNSLLLYKKNHNKPQVIKVKQIDQKKIFSGEMVHFIDCINNDKKPLNSLSNAIYVSKIIDRANKSANTDKTVKF